MVSVGVGGGVAYCRAVGAADFSFTPKKKVDSWICDRFLRAPCLWLFFFSLRMTALHRVLLLAHQCVCV